LKNRFKDITKLILALYLLHASTSFAQINGNEGITLNIGAFTVPIALTSNWKSQPATERKVKEILSFENIKLEPTFTIEGPRGAVIFGTWKDLPNEMTFNAVDLAKSVPNFPESWGIKEDAIFSSSKILPNGLEYSELKVIGNGDGRFFGFNKQSKTIAIWIDIPVTFKDSKGYHSGLGSLYYRGPDTLGKNIPDPFFNTLLSLLKPKDGTTLVSAEIYRKVSSLKDTATSDLPNDSKNVIKNEKNLPISNEMTGMVVIDKETYCVNFGITSKPPCTIKIDIQPTIKSLPIEIVNSINKAVEH
jgi:hypothetical protein